MKLIIQIPCFNKAGDLYQAFAELPREIKVFDTVSEIKQVPLKEALRWMIEEHSVARRN